MVSILCISRQSICRFLKHLRILTRATTIALPKLYNIIIQPQLSLKDQIILRGSNQGKITFYNKSLWKSDGVKYIPKILITKIYNIVHNWYAIEL